MVQVTARARVGPRETDGRRALGVLARAGGAVEQIQDARPALGIGQVRAAAEDRRHRLLHVLRVGVCAQPLGELQIHAAGAIGALVDVVVAGDSGREAGRQIAHDVVVAGDERAPRLQRPERDLLVAVVVEHLVERGEHAVGGAERDLGQVHRRAGHVLHPPHEAAAQIVLVLLGHGQRAQPRPHLQDLGAGQARAGHENDVGDVRRLGGRHRGHNASFTMADQADRLGVDVLATFQEGHTRERV